MLVPMVVRPVTSPLTLFFCNILINRIFLLKMPGVDEQMGGVRPGKRNIFLIYIFFQTNIHIHKTKHAL